MYTDSSQSTSGSTAISTSDSGRREFTNEQLQQIRNSPYVSHTTRKAVSYTLEFKELFWRRYGAGDAPEKIFRDCGFDTDALGSTRMRGLVTMLRRTLERGQEFTEGRTPHKLPRPDLKYNLPKPPRPPRIPRNPKRMFSNDEIMKLFHQVSYLSQELEFLKKTILAGTKERSK